MDVPDVGALFHPTLIPKMVEWMECKSRQPYDTFIASRSEFNQLRERVIQCNILLHQALGLSNQKQFLSEWINDGFQSVIPPCIAYSLLTHEDIREVVTEDIMIDVEEIIVGINKDCIISSA